MNTLLIKNLSKNKNGRFILKDINLSFKSNKIYGIIGNNGAGKTTLFKILLGLVNYSGLITIDNFILNPKNSKEYLRYIGSVMPFPDNYDNFSIHEVFEDHLFYMDCLSNKDIKSMLSNIGLEIPIETKIKELSLGMKQKLNISIALSHNPNILILDEPFNGLDRLGIYALKEIINNFKKEDNLVLISSHSFDELDDIIDEVIVLNSGKVEAADSISMLKKKGINSLEDYYKFLLKERHYEK